jgi:predicted ATPase/class 3 adenylate cyclase
MGVQNRPAVTTFLFTDIEGSTRLWEQEPERMTHAHARHDAIARAAVEAHRGLIVKMTGDGIHAAFDDPLDAVAAALELQQGLADSKAANGIALAVRCGLDAGVVERRDNDYFGTPVNRAARIMAAAHGGQVLVSQPVAALVRERLPDGVSLRDLGVARFRDLTSLERIYQVLHPLIRADFPALRTLATTPNNLPQQVTAFIGRTRELAEGTKLLGKTRLLTLHGVGGIGKSRLALQVAAEVLDNYPDGVWLVELAALADPRVVPLAVAGALGVKEDPGHPLIEALLGFVKERQLFLILDNCEHLLRACAELATQLLQAGRQVRILATSREPLHVAGETTYAVPALAVPGPNQALVLADLERIEAASLFIDRARCALPSLQLTQQNAAAVASICRRLDGIPLAIELAAARVRAISIENIAARLDDRFSLLTRGDTTALPRQQTLRALIDWSFDLLTQPERALLRRLAVFAGGWTLEAAEVVGAGGEVAKAEVLSLLTNLVEKSLVALEADGERYRLLETMRQYALERLDESGEGDAVRARHLDFFLALAEQASSQLVGPDQGAWLARLALEADNLAAAHASCDRTEEGGELGLRLVFAVKLFLFYRGRLALLHRVTLEALDRPGAQGRTRARCRALHTAGQVDSLMGRYAEAQGYLEESLAIAMQIEDKDRAGMVLEELGAVATGQGDLCKARGYLEQALDLAKELGNKRTFASAINALAQLDRMEGKLDKAERLYEQMLALARELEDQESIAIGLLNLAMVSMGRSSHDRASGRLSEALAIAREIGSNRAGQSGLEVSAGLHAWGEAWERAAILFGAAQEQRAQTGLHGDPTDEAFLAPLIAKAQAALGASKFAAAEAAGRGLAYEAAIAQAQAWLVEYQPVPVARENDRLTKRGDPH